jgi:hypothetical protein
LASTRIAAFAQAFTPIAIHACRFIASESARPSLPARPAGQPLNQLRVLALVQVRLVDGQAANRLPL